MHAHFCYLMLWKGRRVEFTGAIRTCVPHTIISSLSTVVVNDVTQRGLYRYVVYNIVSMNVNFMLVRFSNCVFFLERRYIMYHIFVFMAMMGNIYIYISIYRNVCMGVRMCTPSSGR
jgi:hypothetical protein